jgi:surface antigen
LALSLLAALSPAAALNMSGFKDAPITRLTGEELDETPEGTTVEWKAPKTPFVSKITPQRRFSDGKVQCREATVESDARDRFQRGLYTFCKQANGEWQFRIPTSKPKSK